MFIISENVDVFFCGSSIDLRCGFEGLAAAAFHSFQSKIQSEAYFVFINRRRTRIKVLHKGKDNFSIWYVKSRKGVFFPNRKMISSIITAKEFEMILRCEPPLHLIASEGIL